MEGNFMLKSNVTINLFLLKKNLMIDQHSHSNKASFTILLKLLMMILYFNFMH
jgi:hypothetical protein